MSTKLTDPLVLINQQLLGGTSKASIFAWGAPVGGAIDFLILYTSSNPAPNPPVLDNIISAWNAADSRAICFMDRMDSRIVAAYSAVQLQQVFGNVHGQIVTFPGQDLTGADGVPFIGQGQTELLQVCANISLQNVPTMVEFLISGAGGILSLKRKDGTSMSMLAGGDQKSIAISSIALDLNPSGPYLSGALRVSLTAPDLQTFADRLISMTFYATSPDAESGGYDLPSQQCRLIENIKPLGTGAQIAGVVALDIRESSGPWLSGSTPRLANSRIEDLTPGLVLNTTFRNNIGGKISLAVSTDSTVSPPPQFLFARVHDYLDQGFAVPPLDSVLAEFVPIGAFELQSETVDANGMFRILTGRHAGDRLECRPGELLEFQAGCPNILVDPLTRETVQVSGFAPGVQEYMHGAANDSSVHTSWVRHRTKGPPTGAASSGTYYCEPKDDPLFKGIGSQTKDAAPGTPVALDLTRMNLSVGPVGAATGKLMPILPWCGTDLNMDPVWFQKFEGFDGTHMAPVRQLQVLPGTSSAVVAAAPAGMIRGVTPQGLLADINGNNFANVYFGSPKQNQDEITLSSIDPAEVVSPPLLQGEIANRNKIQAALRASQGFFVAYTSVGLSRFSLTLQMDVFTFDVPLPSSANLDATCVIVKMRSDRTSEDLLQHPDAWSCPEALNGEPASIPGQSAAMGQKILTHLNTATGDNPAATRLQQALTQRGWSGILLVKLKIPTGGMPDILEALRPGIQDANFFVHHVGMDLLPAKSKDLSSRGTLQPSAGTAQRFGQAFGLIQYSGNNSDLPATGSDGTYWFLVPSLVIGFSNGRVNYFACEVDVGSSVGFLDSLQGLDSNTNGTNVVKLVGSYASRISNGQEVTVFSLVMTDSHVWNFTNSFISQVTLKGGSFVVTKSDDSSGKSRPLQAQLLFDGELAFDSDNQPILKSLVSVKSLTFSGVGFGFDYSQVGKFPMSFVAGQSSWDIEPNPNVTSSLLSILPVKWTGFRVSLGGLTTLGDLGFEPLNFLPGSSSSLGSGFNFAFELQLDLSGLGKLVGDFSSIKLPSLLGWQKGGAGLCFGIQWPRVNGKLDIGIEQFIRIHADQLAIDQCNDPAHTGIAIVLKSLQLTILGEEIPSQAKIDGFAFVNSTDRGKLAWAFSYLPGTTDTGSWFKLNKFGFAHRLSLPSTGATSSNSVKDIVDNYQIPAVGKSACEALANWQLNLGSDNWLVLGSFTIAGLFEAWFLVDDSKPLYGLYVDLTDFFGAGLLYQKLSADLGKFAGELDLRHIFPPLQFGAASVTLPVIGLEYDTDGGYRIDIGFPWNNDFSRSARVEMGIYVGLGGLYYGRVSAESLKDTIFKVDRPGYIGLSDAEYKAYPYTVLETGFALAVGFGKSLDLGILSASITIAVFGSIEGAMGWKESSSGQLLPGTPQLWYIQGKVGVVLDIEGSVNFVIITAKAVIRASLDIGITKKRILAKRIGDTSAYPVGYLTCPTTLFIEAQLHVHAEATLHIGCVSVTLGFDFNATYSDQFDLDGESFELINPPMTPAALQPAHVPAWIGRFRLADTAPATPLNIMVGAMPTLAIPVDVPDGTNDGGWVDTLVVQTLLDEPTFQLLSKFLGQWVYLSAVGQDISQGVVTMKNVRTVRAFIANANNWDASSIWSKISSLLAGQFQLNFIELPSDPAYSFANSVALGTWPGAVWKARSFAADGTTVTSESSATPSPVSPDWLTKKQSATLSQLPGSPAQSSLTQNTSADVAQFADYVRSLLRGLFGRIETIVVKNGSASAANQSGIPPREMSWTDIWAQLVPATTDPNAPTPLRSLGAELNRALMNGSRLPSPANLKQRLPIARIAGHELAVPAQSASSASVALVGMMGTNVLVTVSRAASNLTAAFQNVRAAQVALDQAISPLATPRWTLSPKEISIGDPGDQSWTSPDGTNWPVRPFGSSLLAEIALAAANVNAQPNKLQSLGAQIWRYTRPTADPLAPLTPEALTPDKWRQALCFSFTAKVNGGRLELLSAPESEREFLDKFYSSFSDTASYALLGVVKEIDNAGSITGSATGSASTLPMKQVVFSSTVTIVRTNLSREARPETSVLMDAAPGSGPDIPYQAVWGSQNKQFIRLLQLAGVTNRGGYFISGAGDFSALQGLKLALKLVLVVTTPATPAGTGNFQWPAWSNAAVINPPAATPGQSCWETMCFYGSAHWDANPTSPAGSVAFAWQMALPDNRSLTTLGDQRHNVVMGLIAGASAPSDASLKPVTIGEARKQLQARLNDASFGKPDTAQAQSMALDSTQGFSNAAQLLDFEMYGVLRADGSDELLFNGDETVPAPPDLQPWLEKPATPVDPGATPVIYNGAIPTALVNTPSATSVAPSSAGNAWRNRFMQRLPVAAAPPSNDLSGSPYIALARYSAVRVTAGFRDLYGNRLSPGRLVPLKIPLYYNDPLISPSQWPGFSLLAYVDPTSNILSLAILYCPLPDSGNQQTQAARQRIYQDVYYQLKGVNSDVSVTVKADFSDLNGTNIASLQLADVTQHLITLVGTLKGAGFAAVQMVPIPVPLASLALPDGLRNFSISLSIERSKAYVPPDAEMGDLALRPDRDGIKSVKVAVPFGTASQTAPPNPGVPKPAVTAEQIGNELEAALPTHWKVRLAYKKNMIVGTEFWLLPENCLPKLSAPSSLPFLWTIRPWNTQLGSGTFPIPQLDSQSGGDGTAFENYQAPNQTFKTQDYDALGRSAIAFLARISAEKDADTLPALGDLLAQMDALAPVLASTGIANQTANNPFLVPLVSGGTAPTSSAIGDARGVLLDAIRSNINAFYQTSAIVQFDLALDAVDPAINVFYGGVSAKWQGAAAAQPSFSDFEVANTSQSHLAFSYDLPAGQDYTQYQINSLTCTVTDIQLNDNGMSSLNDFALGSWIKLLRPLGITPTVRQFWIPTITREYPSSPQITNCALKQIEKPVVSTTSALDIRQFVAITPSVDFSLSSVTANDNVELTLQYNPDVNTPARTLAAAAPGWQWISDLHVLLTLSAMNTYFYEKTTADKRTPLLARFLALAAKACSGLAGTLTGNQVPGVLSTAPVTTNITDLISFNFQHPGATPGYQLTQSGNTANITAASSKYLTPVSSGDQPVWALKPSLCVVRNATAQISAGAPTALNQVLRYQTELVSLPNFIWASVGPRQGENAVTGWVVNPGDNSAIDVRLLNFLASLLGNIGHALDYDLDIVFSHIFTLDSAGKLMTKNVLNPLSVGQGQSVDPNMIATIIKKELDKIPTTANAARWVELDIKFRRLSGNPGGPSTTTETMLIFHERFCFSF